MPWTPDDEQDDAPTPEKLREWFKDQIKNLFPPGMAEVEFMGPIPTDPETGLPDSEAMARMLNPKQARDMVDRLLNNQKERRRNEPPPIDEFGEIEVPNGERAKRACQWLPGFLEAIFEQEHLETRQRVGKTARAIVEQFLKDERTTRRLAQATRDLHALKTCAKMLVDAMDSMERALAETMARHGIGPEAALDLMIEQHENDD